MSKRARKRRDRKKSGANHGNRPNAWAGSEPRRRAGGGEGPCAPGLAGPPQAHPRPRWRRGPSRWSPPTW